MSQSRLIANAAGHKVTTLELFFDLVFVYGISQVTAYLAEDHSALGFLRGLLLAALCGGLGLPTAGWALRYR